MTPENRSVICAKRSFCGGRPMGAPTKSGWNLRMQMTYKLLINTPKYAVFLRYVRSFRVGATSGRPPFRSCKNAGMRYQRSPASGAVCRRQAARTGIGGGFRLHGRFCNTAADALTRAASRARPDAGREVCTTSEKTHIDPSRHKRTAVFHNKKNPHSAVPRKSILRSCAMGKRCLWRFRAVQARRRRMDAGSIATPSSMTIGSVTPQTHSKF